MPKALSWLRCVRDAELAEGYARGARLVKAGHRDDRAELVGDTLMEEVGHGANVDEEVDEGQCLRASKVHQVGTRRSVEGSEGS